MYLSLLFWLALALPGYVVVRRFWNEDNDAGLLGVVAVSYLATYGLLSPVSILCYVLHAPLWIFTGTIVLAVLAALILITWYGWWVDILRLFAGACVIEALILLADMIMGGASGAFLGGDAVLHLARVRTLIDQGFNNYDPFVAGDYFFPIYHTNIHHALYAACAQLTGLNHIAVWIASLPFGKLLIIAGPYYLVWRVFESRPAAWAAAVFVVAWHGPVDFVVYPNKIAPFFIAPVMFGFAMKAIRDEPSWRPAGGLATGSLVLGQIHSLYGAFMGLALAPPVLAVTLWRALRRRSGAGHRVEAQLITAVVALSAAAPFLIVSKTAADRAKAASVEPLRAAGDPRGADRDEDDEWTADGLGPRAGWGTLDWRTALLAAGTIIALTTTRRRYGLVMLSAAAIVAAIFYIPPLFQFTVELLRGERWIVSRMGFILHLAFLALALAAPVYWLHRHIVDRFLARPSADQPTSSRWRRLLLRGGIRLAVVAAVLAIGVVYSQRGPDSLFTWSDYARRVKNPENRQVLQVILNTAPFLAENVEPGETVLAPPYDGMILTMIYDCHIVAPQRGSVGVPNMAERRRDLMLMLAPDTPWPTRRELLEKHDIHLFLPARSHIGWALKHARTYHKQGPTVLFEIDTT